MKKKVIAAIGAMAVAGTIGFAFSQSGVVNADPKLSANEIREQVNAEYPGTITELELDKKGKNSVYEVEVELEGKEYELKIDGDTGEVIKLEEKVISQKTKPKSDDKDDKQADDKQKKEKVEITEKKESTNKDKAEEVKTEDNKKAETKSDDSQDDKKAKTKSDAKQDDKPKKSTNDVKDNKSSSKKTVIGSNQAKKIALQNFDGTIEELELDDDDGRLVYEIEMYKGNSEAEIEIDAYTGEVLVIEIETEDDDD
ncbi:PepSY domain-containing protein [Oceanobacillus halophilus]|uniref:PepSY domain-containing protein n=1 Tax=Oceanobacillus halophilus TaxID=930130 RepID=A0A494ZXT5_9BACI|nr:PepSY domain-containing protein [Oceanobacillus halophilus]RKQ30912.1 hypothetical protein D8M06_14895 [Oceanobacillus halophilus]